MVGLWQETDPANICAKPQAKAVRQSIWSRGVTASGRTKRGPFVSNSKRDPLPEARCCITSLARGTEYSDEQHGWNGDAL